jgi:hypothetical protein
MVDQFWENIMKTWITKTIVVSACVLGIAGCASPVDRMAEKPYAIRIQEEMLTAQKILHPALPKMMKQSRLPQCQKL